MLRSDLPALAKLVDDLNPYVQRLITPAEREQLAALVPSYEAALKPAKPEYIERSIGMLAVAFPGAKVSDSEAKVRLGLYIQGLADVPGDLLANACRETIQTCTFFPTVAELRKRCKDLYSRQFRLARIKHLIAKHDREWREPEPEKPMSPKEQAKVNDYLRRHGIGEPAQCAK